jgi:hypothetical protein
MIKEIIAQLEDEGLNIPFRMDSGYFDDVSLETIEALGCTDGIQGKGYPPLVEQVTDPSIVLVTGKTGRETTELVIALNTGDKARRFVVSRVLKDEKDRKQLSFLESEAYDYFSLSPIKRNYCRKKWLNFMKNAGIVKITSKKPRTLGRLGTCCSNHFGLMKRSFR